MPIEEFLSCGGEVQKRYEMLRLKPASLTDGSSEPVGIGEPLETFLDRFNRYGMLGLFDEDPLGFRWRKLVSDEKKGDLFSLELIGGERRDARERWNNVYQILWTRAERLQAAVPILENDMDQIKERSDHEICLVR